MSEEQEGEKILVFDFGGQYTQLIARRVREANVFSELVPYDLSIKRIKEENPRGIILSGGPASVYEENARFINKTMFNLDIPMLGICYGMQLMVHMLPGGKVKRAERREYGSTKLVIDKQQGLFAGLDEETVCWMSHGDRVNNVPDNFEVYGHTENSPIAAMGDPVRKLYGVQFHPEVSHTPQGSKIIKNFLFNVCGCSGTWTTASFIQQKVKEIKEEVGYSNVICGLSGGVDSSVAATLVHKAIGNQLTCIFVNHGLLRKKEVEQVRKMFGEKFDMDLDYVDAKRQFFDALTGISDPEEKRNVIGEEFIKIFEKEAAEIENVDFLVQGTIYSDFIESGGRDQAAMIKSHHNVGGLPEKMDLKLIEPLRTLFKDEVREVGKKLGLPEDVVWRQPFPGPGLAIRIIGEVNPEKIKVLQEADAIFRQEIKKADLHREIWQYFAVLPSIKSVGVMGDARTYKYTVALRAVKSVDAMTADWAKIPHNILERISIRITNEVEQVNRVVYDITSKPPATIEWE